MSKPSDFQTDHQLLNVDGHGTAINRQSSVYHDYMSRWHPPGRFILWVNAVLFSIYKGWEAYSEWRTAKRPKHYPIGIEERNGDDRRNDLEVPIRD